MAEHGWAMLCNRAITDRVTNQISLIDSVDQLSLDGELARANLGIARLDGHDGVAIGAKLVLAIWWYRSDPDVPETAVGRMRVIDPAGAEVAISFFDAHLEASHGARLLIGINAFPFSGPGRYFFVVEKMVKADKWKRVARLPLLAIYRDEIATSPTAPAQPSSPPLRAEPSLDSPPAPAHPSPRRASPKRRRPGSSPRRGRK
jgi:hypothetical protein